ncbi:MAG TPA: 50S ribosomal protein L11 methyltransferase, partial [Nitrospirota bacterium]
MASMWDEYKITLPDELREPVMAVCYDLGCEGITEERGYLLAYIPVSVGHSRVTEALSVFPGLTVTGRLLEDQDWYATWKETFVPFESEGIIVCPPWRTVEPQPGQRVMMLDPGQAFGTGEHVTTRMVMRMMREWCEAQGDGIADKDFHDFGTGTGILSIAAYFFGLMKISAVDFE